ncbi:Arginase [Fusarium oxysporum f. sp. rapae]|uniref:Arginase n=1 Tax=Fusarium oxysporum f. sp. rapae TaxID=485398 RepID=A0A8J5NLX3_FUSOX|nr:Arginase [Fusarium oxysporum f. sp. rapae]
MAAETGWEWPDVEPPVETGANFELLAVPEELPSDDDTPWEELQALEISRGPIMAEIARRSYHSALYEHLINSEIDWSLDGHACRVVGCPRYGDVFAVRADLQRHLETTAHRNLDASLAPLDEVVAADSSPENIEELPSLLATEATPQPVNEPLSPEPRGLDDAEIPDSEDERQELLHQERQQRDKDRLRKEEELFMSSARNEDINISVCEDVERTISNNFKSSSKQPEFQVVLGGECCMLPAILSAFWKHAESQSQPKRVGLIYIDADTDLTSPTDPSSIGTFAGMNMAHLVRLSGALPRMEQFSRSSGEPVCDASNTVFFGTNMSLPGNKPEHFKYLFDNNFKVVSSTSVAKDPEQRARDALKVLQDKVDIIMVHLDVDSIDPETFPLANVPNFTGVEFENMMRALKVLLGSEKVGGLTVAEVNPDHDPGLKMTERLTSQIVEMLAARK